MGIQKQLERKNVTGVVLLISNNMQRFNTSVSFFLLMWPDHQIIDIELCIFVITVFKNPLTHDWKEERSWFGTREIPDSSSCLMDSHTTKSFKSFQNHGNQIYSVLRTSMACFSPSFTSPVFVQCVFNQREYLNLKNKE